MPFSKPSIISVFLEELPKIEFKTILDIGIGYGLYGALIRNYYETKIIEGVEKEKRYDNALWGVYDKIYIGDIRNFTLKKYDLILLIDVIEHLTKKDGKALLARMEKLSKNIFISTPLEFSQNTGWEDFPSEKHKSLWTMDDFKGYKKMKHKKQIIARKYG